MSCLRTCFTASQRVVASTAPLVVPAKAGTHSHRRSLLWKVSDSVPQRDGTAYGSLLSQGRRKRIRLSNNRYDFALATRSARGVAVVSAQQRAWGMPGARCTHSPACEVGSAHGSSPQVHRDHPAFPHAMVLTASFVLSPVTGLFCHRRQRISRVCAR